MKNVTKEEFYRVFGQTRHYENDISFRGLVCFHKFYDKGVLIAETINYLSGHPLKGKEVYSINESYYNI